MNKYNPAIHHRKSIRLKGYDYSQAGLYFITIGTQNHINLFGKIDNGKMILNNAGIMIKKWYYELENKFPNIKNHEIIGNILSAMKMNITGLPNILLTIPKNGN